MPKASVIVPIYNVEKYLRKCIKSIMNQSLNDIEIILVNDGSFDKCDKICREYVNQDSRIKYYYKKNGGLSSARNYGIDKASGEYLYFVDSDDYIEYDTCEILYNEAVNTGADIVVGGYRTIDESTGISSEYIPKMPLKYYHLDDSASKSTFIDNLIQEEIVIEVIWNKLYHRSIFSNISFPYRKFEDSFMCFTIYDRAHAIVFVNNIIYNYLVNRVGSITSSNKPSNIERLDSYYMKAFCFYDAYPNLKSTNEYYYMCLKTILRILDEDNNLRYTIRPILAKILGLYLLIKLG